MAKHSEVISELIRTGRQQPWFSSSDYVEPIQRYFNGLTLEERNECRADLVGMLGRSGYLIELTEICAALKINEACDRIFHIAQDPPQRLRVDGHVIPGNHIRAACIAALGRLKYTGALRWLRSLLEKRLGATRTKPEIPHELSALLINMAALDLDAALGYLPQCVKSTWKQVLQHKRSAEDLYRKAGRHLSQPVQFDAGTQHCLLEVVRRRGMVGLKQILKRVTVDSDAEYDFWRNSLISLLVDLSKKEGRPASTREAVENQAAELLQFIRRS